MGIGVVLMIGLNAPKVTVGGVGVELPCLRCFELDERKPALLGREVVVRMGLKPLIVVDGDGEKTTLGRLGWVVFCFCGWDVPGVTFRKILLVVGLLSLPLDLDLLDSLGLLLKFDLSAGKGMLMMVGLLLGRLLRPLLFGRLKRVTEVDGKPLSLERELVLVGLRFEIAELRRDPVY